MSFFSSPVIDWQPVQYHLNWSLELDKWLKEQMDGI